jgi:phage/plasmid primase-like uncharacterized protein
MITEFTAASIGRGLGGRQIGPKWICRCPAHPDHDHPNLEVVEKNGKVLWICRAGCSQEAVGAKLIARGLYPNRDTSSNTHQREYREMRERLQRANVSAEPTEHDEEENRIRQDRRIVRIAAGARDNAKDWTTPERPVDYFKGRGLKAPPNAMLLSAEVIRSHRLPIKYRGFPIVVFPVFGDAGLQAAHITVLTRDGKKNLRDKGKSIRRFFGKAGGGYIPLGRPFDPDRPGIMAEGVETALAVSELTGYPAIAAGSAHNLKKVTPPACSELIICGDNDESGTGRNAAEAAAELISQIRPVRIAIPERYRDWAKAFCDPNADHEELRQAIVGAKRFKAPVASTASSTPRTLTTRSLDRFERREVEWLWWPFVPLREVTTLYGEGGAGKSSVTLDMAARIIGCGGGYWPRFGDEPKEEAARGDVLLLTKEDDPYSIIRPRLEAAGADEQLLKHVHYVGYADPDDDDQFDPLDRLDTNMTLLEQKIAEIGNVKLVVVDPVPDFSGAVDNYRDDQIRSLLTPLVRIARKHDLAIIIVIHINKKEDLTARNRALGGVAYINAPRSAVAVGEDPEDPSRKIMVQSKQNLTRGRRGVAFTTKSARGAHKIEWEPEWATITADELLAPGKRKSSKVEQAQQFLQERLADGPVPSTELVEQAETSGVSKRTLDEAKKKLGVKSRRLKNSDKWSWSLPKRT